jgi:hypothetical protein
MINKNFIIALTISFVASIELNAQTPGKQTPAPKTTIKLVKPVETNSKNSTTATNLQKKPTDSTQTKQTNTNNTATTTTNSGLKLNMKEFQNSLQKDSLKRDQIQKDATSISPNGKRPDIKNQSVGTN